MTIGRRIGLAFLLVLAVGVGLAIFVAGFATCCVGFVLLSIPYLGSVILLPVSFTYRAFGPEFLAQFGPEYSIWPSPEETAGPGSEPSPPPEPGGTAPSPAPESPPPAGG